MDLEKLQLMMLFSVVGRKDETGFADGGANGRAVYQGFRATSGLEYLKYCRAHATHAYPSNDAGLEDLYRDAIVVELMGFPSIQDAIQSSGLQKVLINYVMGKAGVTETEAVARINNQEYTLGKLFSTLQVRQKADSMLQMMNEAHALELTRCYSLYAEKTGQPSALKILHFNLEKSGFFASTPNAANEENLTSFFNVMRCSFDAMEITGQKTTFCFASRSEFESKKAKIITDVNIMKARFDSDPAYLAQEVAQAQAENKVFVNNDPTYQRNYLITNYITKQLQSPALQPTRNMFNFQNHNAEDPTIIDHHQNAVNLVSVMQIIKPFPGVSTPSLPLIAKVRHNREHNLVMVIFDSQAEAEKFKQMYSLTFPAVPDMPDIIDYGKGRSAITIPRNNYKQIVKDRQVEFKLVSIPKTVEGEEDLVNEQGEISVLNLVTKGEALARLVSTTALNRETFPDYGYLFNALDDPINNRYSPNKKPGETRTRFYDPRNGNWYDRTITGDIPPCFQEPETEPVSLEDKRADGWTVGSGGAAKNTIYIKKLAHSQLPVDGQVAPFEGYQQQKTNYFPIGVLSDLTQVDIKDNRFVWAQNMATQKRFWLTEVSPKFTQEVFSFLHQDGANLDDASFKASCEAMLKGHKGLIIKGGIDPKALIKLLTEREKQFQKLMNEKHWRPTDEVLAQIGTLLQKEKDMIVNIKISITDKLSPDDLHTINDIYSKMETRFKQEQKRKSLKYATTPEVIKELQGHDAHNELLVANTKKAVQALYATRDRPFDRLNLVFHATQIKEQYGYDIPLLVLSQDKPPINYTEALIKEDIEEAYRLIQAGTFPYDTTEYPVYLYTNKLIGPGRFEIQKDPITGMPIPALDAAKKPIFERKNQAYQEKLLLDLFQLGIPELTSLQQIRDGEINAAPINQQVAVSNIVDKINLVGGFKREKHLLKDIFAGNDVSKKESFFLRTVALGHMELLTAILLRPDYHPSIELITKAITVAEKNQQPTLKKYLTDLSEQVIKQNEALKQELVRLNETPDPVDRLKHLVSIYHEFSISIPDAELARLIQKTIQGTIGQDNINKIDSFMSLLNDKDFFKLYTEEVLNKGITIDVALLTDCFVTGRQKAVIEMLEIVQSKDSDAARFYNDLLKTAPLADGIPQAQKFLNYARGSNERTLVNMQNELKAQCDVLIQQIELKDPMQLNEQVSAIKATVQNIKQGITPNANIMQLLGDMRILTDKSFEADISLKRYYEQEQQVRTLLQNYDGDGKKQEALILSYRELRKMTKPDTYDVQLRKDILAALPPLDLKPGSNWMHLTTDTKDLLRLIDEYTNIWSGYKMDSPISANSSSQTYNAINGAQDYLSLYMINFQLRQKINSIKQMTDIMNMIHKFKEQIPMLGGFFSKNQQRGTEIKLLIAQLTPILQNIHPQLYADVLTSKDPSCIKLQDKIKEFAGYVTSDQRFPQKISRLLSPSQEQEQAVRMRIGGGTEQD